MGPASQPGRLSTPPLRRFRIGSLEPDEAGLLHADAGVHRHLRVLRLAPGDVVYLFDGGGGEVEAQIAVLDDARASLRPIAAVERGVESWLDSCLVQAVPLRSSRMETIVRQVTELGVRRIVPVIGERSRRPGGDAASLERKLRRWRRVADAAAEQSRRTRVPDIDAPLPLQELAWEGLPRPMFIAEPGTTRPGHDDAGDAESTAARGDGVESTGSQWADAAGAAGSVTVLVGPEGGWSDDEITAAMHEGASALSLGPRVLRADTAGVVALSVFQYLWGDLRRRQTE